MRMKSLAYIVAVVGTCVAAVGSAYAEGRCPAGQYPIGGPGWGGCAPIPQGAAAPAPRADGRWHKTWGAIALSNATSTVGTSSGRMKKSEAVKEAQERCAVNGGTDCRELTYPYENTCVALVGPPAGVQRPSSLGTGTTEEEAIATGREFCGRQSTECVVYHQDCTKPVYEKF